jgi:hypothetical protein
LAVFARSVFTLAAFAMGKKKMRRAPSTRSHWERTMNRRSAVFAFALGLAFVLAPRLSLAAEDHVAEAITHTQEAISVGKAGHADQLVTHAKAALTHAEAAEKAKANPHVAEGITHLKAAIEHGEKGHADVGTSHAEEALKHLEMAK